MANYEVRRKASIGSSSMILIFIVLCLATFGMLTLGNARREDALSEKSAEAVTAYYEADSQGVSFLAAADQAIKSGGEAQVMDTLGQYYQADTNMLRTDIPMNAGQALRIELEPDWEKKTLRVLAWNVYQQEVYEIDQSIPIWTGSAESQ